MIGNRFSISTTFNKIIISACPSTYCAPLQNSWPRPFLRNYYINMKINLAVVRPVHCTGRTCSWIGSVDDEILEIRQVTFAWAGSFSKKWFFWNVADQANVDQKKIDGRRHGKTIMMSKFKQHYKIDAIKVFLLIKKKKNKKRQMESFLHVSNFIAFRLSKHPARNKR